MEIRERIIVEAGTMFSKYGIRSVTMDALAEEMGISKRTIYENFKDKDTLLMEVISFYKTRQLKDANEIFTRSQNVVEVLFSLLNGMINIMKQINPVFFHDMKRFHSDIFKKLQEKGDIRDHSITRRILKEGTEQDIFRKDLNLELINLTLHELFNLFSPDSRLTNEGYDRKELFNNILIPYLRGISTDKGIKLIDQQNNL
ncbi:MAG: TetR/AcrR family transcriptional regulator [Bacteroidales bacterium]|nr:TetR/AcrR family transcriptional regulator [Bacteroidales bacterium]